MFQKILLNKYFWLLFIPLTIGWHLLVLRLEARNYHAASVQKESVKKIWGGNLKQPMPSVRYKGFGSDVANLDKGRIHSADIAVKLIVDYRKKGLIHYTGYKAEFSGTYTIKNPKAEKIYLSFIFPYPMREGEGMLRNVKLLVDNQEDVENTEYQQNLIIWTGQMEPEQSLDIQVGYIGRGLNYFMYGFEGGRQINRFKMKIDVLGSSNVDYPVSTMTPTQTAETGEGKTLKWDLDSVNTMLNIGVILPDKINIARQIAVMSKRAPVFLALFLAAVFVIMSLNGFKQNFVRIAVIGAAYFLFYPWFAYLAAYMNTALSFIIALGVIGLLIFNYTRIVCTLKTAAAVSLAYVFFLGLTSLAALLPTYTGLILTIEGVLLLAWSCKSCPGTRISI